MSFYKEIKSYNNSLWLKVFFHSNKDGLNGFSNEEEAKYCVNNPYKYSILSKINEKFKINNVYEFIIEYPELGVYNIWQQEDNPLEIEESVGYSVNGFVEIETNAYDPNWGGLAKTTISTLNGKNSSLLDGCPNSDEWYFAIGMYQDIYWKVDSTTHYSLPAYNQIETNTVALWLKMPRSILCTVNKHRKQSFAFILFTNIIYVYE